MFLKNFKRPKNEGNAIVFGRSGTGKVFSNIRPEGIHNDEILCYAKEGKLQELEEEVSRIDSNNLHLSCAYQNISEDVKNIKKKIKKYSIFQPCLKHCCNPDGEGYWVLWDKSTPKQKHYFPSSLELENYGATASDSNLIRLYLYGLHLYDFLSLIKQECNVEMEIKYLYFPYVFRCLDEYKGVNEFFPSLDAEKMLDDLVQKYGDFRNAKTFEYYNGEDAVYYLVNENIEKCINAIYRDRDALEQNGLWRDAKNVIRLMHDIKFRNAIDK